MPIKDNGNGTNPTIGVIGVKGKDSVMATTILRLTQSDSYRKHMLFLQA
jgi:hypothetical protein